MKMTEKNWRYRKNLPLKLYSKDKNLGSSLNNESLSIQIGSFIVFGPLPKIVPKIEKNITYVHC